MGFVEKYQNVLIVLIVIVFIGFVLYNNPITINLPDNIFNLNTNQPASIIQTEEQMVNLPELFLPYFVATNVINDCSAFGGNWVSEPSFVGCVGVGAPDCGNAFVLSAGQQCNSVGAVWTCNNVELSCGYE